MGVVSKETAATLLRRLRQEQGTSLRQVATDVGLAASQLSRLERGERSLTTPLQERLAHYYDVPKEDFALANGILPADVADILLEHPEEVERLRRTYAKEQ